MNPLEDVCETLADGRYVRYDSSACVFNIHYNNVLWNCYDAHDEDECLECFWIAITLEEEDSQAREETLRAVTGQLATWTRIKHPLVLSIRELTVGEDGKLLFITDMCGRNSLRTYRSVHDKLGCPAIRKISRQLIKAMTKVSSHSPFPVHHLTANDIQINAATAAICVLPTFLWRILTPLQVSADSRKAYTQVDLLRAWVAIVVELFSGVHTDDLSREELLALVERVPDADAQTLLNLCLRQDEAQELPLSELLEYTFLNTRQDVGPLPRQRLCRRTMTVPGGAPRSGSGIADVAGSESACSMSTDSRQHSAPEGRALSLRSMWPELEEVAGSGDVDGRFSAFGNDLDAPEAAAHALREVDTEIDSGGSSSAFRVGVVKGLDYTISANGSVDASGQLIDFTVRLMRTTSGSMRDGDIKVVTFPFDVRHDTVDAVAAEMAPVIGMEETDVEMTAAAMREVIAQQLPGLERMWSFQVKEGSLPSSSGRLGSQPSGRPHTSIPGTQPHSALQSTPENEVLLDAAAPPQRSPLHSMHMGPNADPSAEHVAPSGEHKPPSGSHA